MKKISLTQEKFALVDDSVFDYLNQWKWKFDKSTGYACRTIYPRGKVYMHKLIHPTIGDFQTDHINRNKLDNRRENLRTVTFTENIRNSGIRITNTSGYKGVSLLKARNKWEAYIHINYLKVGLGYFNNIKDAIEARKKGEELYWI